MWRCWRSWEVWKGKAMKDEEGKGKRKVKILVSEEQEDEKEYDIRWRWRRWFYGGGEDGGSGNRREAKEGNGENTFTKI